jgi:hypothetical protein
LKGIPLELAQHRIKLNITIHVATLALGLWPKQGLTKMQAKSEPKSHISCSR